ncbi:MAG: hypothetical protein SH859_15885 [Hyphomicrobium aestuarii]|nr:hypothetical protein [Hyphomicrobium aestuarii]
MMTAACIDPSPVRAGKAGQGIELALIGTETIEVHTYRPRGCSGGGLMFIFPGYERNAHGYMRRARRIAREECLTIFAPEMDQDRFPRSRYQRAGVSRAGRASLDETCMGLFLRRLLDWARRLEQRPDAPYVLFGHSAGAQLLSRVAAYCPMQSPARIILANPSSYVAPSLIEPAPYGFGGILDVREREERLRACLAQPITIYLGDADLGDFRLDETANANRQGPTRFARGQATYQAGRDMAVARGWAFNWRLVVAKGIGHSSKGMLRAAEMSAAIGASGAGATDNGDR